MDQPVELGVASRSGFAAILRSLGSEEILDTAAEAGDVPRQAVPLDRTGDACLEPLAERDHARERLVGQHLVERRARRSERQHVRSDRPADTADVGPLVSRQQRLELFGDLAREPVGGGRDTGGDRLPDGQQIRIEPVCAV